MTKVLEVAYVFDYGGIRAFIMNYLALIDKEKFQVDIYAFGCSESPFTNQVEDLGCHIYFEPQNNVRKIKLFITQLKAFMAEHGPYDVVHANCNLISAWVLVAAKQMGVPVRISHSHSTSHFYGSIVQKSYCLLRRMVIDRFSTVKLACGQLAGETMYGKKSHFLIANNGINIERFSNRNPKRIKQLRERFNIPVGAKIYSNITRMDTNKNHIFAVEVFNEIHKFDPTAVFVYGGVTPTMQSTVEMVKARIEELGLQEYVRYTGPFMDIEQVYHMTDLWIYCSAYEGLPFGPLELQAASVPCIASDVITKEIDLGLGLIHFLSLNDSPKKWAELANSIQKKQIGQEKISQAFENHDFDIKKNVKKLESIYLGELR